VSVSSASLGSLRDAPTKSAQRRGHSTKQIADDLHLSTETVRNHIRSLFQALGVNSRLEAVAAARPARHDPAPK
jgi:predicted ArsR family transcriptional regulator